MVAESVAISLVHGAVSTSASGAIAYRTGTTSLRQLTWFDRSGRTLDPLGEPDRSGQINVNLSRDGRRAAVQHLQKDQGVGIIDSARTSPFTFNADGEGWPIGCPMALKSFMCPTRQARTLSIGAPQARVTPTRTSSLASGFPATGRETDVSVLLHEKSEDRD